MANVSDGRKILNLLKPARFLVSVSLVVTTGSNL